MVQVFCEMNEDEEYPDIAINIVDSDDQFVGYRAEQGCCDTYEVEFKGYRGRKGFKEKLYSGENDWLIGYFDIKKVGEESDYFGKVYVYIFDKNKQKRIGTITLIHHHEGFYSSLFDTKFFGLEKTFCV